MERKRSEAAVIRDNIAEDLYSLNRKKNSLCLLSESGRKNHGERRNIYQSKGHYKFKRNGNQGFTRFIHKGNLILEAQNILEE